MMQKIYALFVFLKGFAFPCHEDVKNHGFEKSRTEYKIKKVARLDKEINESSGLATTPQKTLLTINDSGGKPIVFEIDTNGVLLKKHFFEGVSNTDWETIECKDSTIFIGDVGNNANRRKDLKIYKLGDSLEVIPVVYPDQKSYPPTAYEMNYDCEAMVALDSSLLLISKNRGGGEIQFYFVLYKGNKVEIENGLELKGMITGAAVSPNNKKLLLISYGYIYMHDLDVSKRTIVPSEILYFQRAGQMESVTFINNNDFFVTNEQGRLFKFIRKK